MARLLACFAIVVACVGCDMPPDTNMPAIETLESMRFMRHSSGQCFAVIQFRSYGMYSGISIAAVDAKFCPLEK